MMGRIQIDNPMKLPNRGFSLVELMVATVLGLIISLAVVRSFMGSKEGFMLTQSNTDMQQNGRFALSFLVEGAQMAGFRPVNSFRNSAFPALGAWGEGQIIGGTDGASSADTLRVRFYGYDDAYMRDCMGNTVADADLINFNYVTQEYAVVNENLTCAIDGGAAQILVEGVEKMEVLYGVDADGDRYTDYYQTATQVGATDQWENVTSVKMFVIARAFDEVLDVDNDRTYRLNGENHTFNDDMLRDVFTTTVGLKNVLTRS